MPDHYPLWADSLPHTFHANDQGIGYTLYCTSSRLARCTIPDTSIVRIAFPSPGKPNLSLSAQSHLWSIREKSKIQKVVEGCAYPVFFCLTMSFLCPTCLPCNNISLDLILVPRMNSRSGISVPISLLLPLNDPVGRIGWRLFVSDEEEVSKDPSGASHNHHYTMFSK